MESSRLRPPATPMGERILRRLKSLWLPLLLMTLLLAGAGIWVYVQRLLDAVPVLPELSVEITALAPDLGTRQIEQQVVGPLELAVAGLPELAVLRVDAEAGLCELTVVLEHGTDLGTAVRRIKARIQPVVRRLPRGVRVKVAPLHSGG